MADRIRIIDLDGTLIPGNSFTQWVRYCLTAFPSRSVALAWTVLLRKLRLISHYRAKQRIMRAVSDKINAESIAPFIGRMKKQVRPMFVGMLAGHDGVNCLATAAPKEYAQPLGKMLGFDMVYATDTVSPEENKGEEKVASLERSGIRFTDKVDVYTDHYDDLPLLETNSKGRNYLVAPSDHTLEVLKRSGLSDFYIIK